MVMEGNDGADGADSFVPGPPGAAGATGPAGVSASAFIMVMEGNDGADGADSFVPGPQGLTGATGPAGVQGSQGRPGEDGNDGADSFVPGPAGPAGPAGSIGSNASSFILLMEGNDGADGADSMVPGTAGAAGATGPTGAGGGGITPTPASGNWIAPPYLAHRDQSLAGFVMVINTVYYIPFIPTTTITVKSLGIFVTTGGVSGTTQFAIYGSSTNTGKPAGLPLSSTGSGTSTANNTACTAALGSPATLTLTAGTLYWLAVNTSVAITVRSAGPMSYAASVVGDATFANVLSQTGLFTGYSTTVTFGSWPTATAQTLTPTKEGSLPFPLLQIN